MMCDKIKIHQMSLSFIPVFLVLSLYYIFLAYPVQKLIEYLQYQTIVLIKKSRKN